MAKSDSGLAVHDFGGDGPPLLIAHATGFCAGAYEPLAARLASGFHVWGVDFRGHGDSSAPVDGNFAWTGMAEDVVTAIDRIGGGPVYGVGHSMGGACLLLAEAGRPGLLTRVYAYEPILLTFAIAAQREGGPSSPLSAAARRRRATFSSRGEAMLRYASRPGLNTLRADALAAYVQHGFEEYEDGAIRLKCEPENEARTFESASVTIDDVRGIGALPVMVGLGARDEGAMPAMMAPLVAEALPGGQLVRYAHLGHFGPLEDPDTIAADILKDASGLV